MVEIGDILLCTVERVNNTVVSIVMENGKEGSIIMSEIAPGRIRNIRDYVFPGKKIICKVIRIQGDRVDLSLRRVTLKETKEKREQLSLEKSSISILKSVLGDKAEEIIKNILTEGTVYEFLQESKKDSSNLEKLIGKDACDKVLHILNSQKVKSVLVKKIFNLTSDASDGIVLIKNILSNFKDVKIRYLAAGKYSIVVEDKDKKTADNKIKKVFDELTEQAKKSNISFVYKEK
jgi:translation initiation factor 2 subunit 1